MSCKLFERVSLKDVLICKLDWKFISESTGSGQTTYDLGPMKHTGKFAQLFSLVNIYIWRYIGEDNLTFISAAIGL